MARKNRMSVYDGIYHVTTRIAHRAMLLKDDSVKDEILRMVVSVARFSGVELWAFCIMDNHLHLFVRVPPVPKRYWLDAGDEPVAYAFGMRPPECRESICRGRTRVAGAEVNITTFGCLSRGVLLCIG